MSHSTYSDTCESNGNSGPPFRNVYCWPTSVRSTKNAEPGAAPGTPGGTVTTRSTRESGSSRVYSSAASTAWWSNHRWVANRSTVMTGSFAVLGPRRWSGTVEGRRPPRY